MNYKQRYPTVHSDPFAQISGWEETFDLVDKKIALISRNFFSPECQCIKSMIHFRNILSFYSYFRIEEMTVVEIIMLEVMIFLTARELEKNTRGLVNNFRSSKKSGDIRTWCKYFPCQP